MASSQVTPEAVLALQGPTSRFLCPLSANIYHLDFLNFSIKDVESNQTVFNVSKDPNQPPPNYPPNFNYDQLRMIQYQFPQQFLDFTTVGTSLTFKVGDLPVNNFRMIERHYYQNTLIKSYDFTFSFCPPNTVNNWSTEYEMPVLPRDLRNAIAHGSYQDNQSDTFYFVDNQLVMHNKAQYMYYDKKP